MADGADVINQRYREKNEDLGMTTVHLIVPDYKADWFKEKAKQERKKHRRMMGEKNYSD